MITIFAHGVEQRSYPEFAGIQLSTMQYRLLTDPAPIRICGAPTGAGKTYAFLQGIRVQGYWVLFVVPTQALAANIADIAQNQGIDAVVWDSTQQDHLVETGQDVWRERLNQIYCIAQHGGMVITTPETLAQIFLGVPYRRILPEMDINLLLSAEHIVFDEVHLLTERALGFLQAWMTLIGGQAVMGHPKTHLTFLSATHSDMLMRLVGPEIPEHLVSHFDEDVITLPESAEFREVTQPIVRLLHGDVTVRIADDTVPNLLRDYLTDLLNRHARLLVVFDSLKQYSQNAARIAKYVRLAGLTPGQIFVVTGQERQAGTALDSVNFDVGIQPHSRHRLIMGTSALEVGITYPQVTAAIIDVGLTPAALLQRIGRVARGDQLGEILVAAPSHSVPSHFLTLQQLEAHKMTAEEFRQAFAPYVPIHWGRARTLGSAYWSMLHHTHAPADQALRALYGTMSEKPLLGAQLNQLWWEATQLKPNGQRIYRQWLDAVNRTLQDIRGFLPTVLLQFNQSDPVTYARDWALRYLRAPDRIDVDRNQWIYNLPRDQCLLDQPRCISLRLLLPTREQSMTTILYPGPQAYGRVLEDYVTKIRHATEFDFHPIWDHTCNFIAATGLLIWATFDNVVDIPVVDGSMAL